MLDDLIEQDWIMTGIVGRRSHAELLAELGGESRFLPCSRRTCSPYFVAEDNTASKLAGYTTEIQNL
jgi:hypothetical protein